MKIAVVDIQGYTLPEEFIIKELSIKVGDQHEHFVFKPPYPYNDLSLKEKRIVNVSENKLLGIRYSYGKIEYGEIDGILQKYLTDVDYVYVRGNQKYKFLRERLSKSTKLVNIENISVWNSPPKCEPTDTSCLHHMRGSYRCTEIIIENIYNWLVKCLPQ